MLNKIIQYSLHNRLLVMIAAIALLVWGSITAHNMEVDVFPDLNAPTVVVMTEAQGMAPEEVERLVTFPVETAVNGATDVRRVRSSSTTGFSVVWNKHLYCPADRVGKTRHIRRSSPFQRRTTHPGAAILHLGRDHDYRVDGRHHFLAGFAYDSRLDNPPAPALHRRCGTGCRDRW